MKENKELWPGAGLWLDFISITGKDFKKVERRLNEIDGPKAKMKGELDDRSERS